MKVWSGQIRYVKQMKVLTRVTQVNGWSNCLHESKLPFVSRVDLIRCKFSIFFSAHVSGSLSEQVVAGGLTHV